MSLTGIRDEPTVTLKEWFEMNLLAASTTLLDEDDDISGEE